MSVSDVQPDGPSRSLQACFARRFLERKNRPIWNALQQALLKECEALERLLNARYETEEAARAALVAAKRIIRKNILELFRWLDPGDGILTEGEIEEIADLLDHKAYANLTKHVGKRTTPGPPIERRDLAVRALELKSADQPPAWAEIARKLCPCGKTRHDKACMENIRRNVNRLKLVLHKYSIPIAG